MIGIDFTETIKRVYFVTFFSTGNTVDKTKEVLEAHVALLLLIIPKQDLDYEHSIP